MTRTHTRSAARPLPSLDAVLYRHTHQLFLPEPAAGTRTPPVVAGFADGLAAYGQVVSRPLFQALEQLSDPQLHLLEQQVIGLPVLAVGAHRRHLPLFKGFPQSTPHDTYLYYLQRLLTFYGRKPGTPCALDGDRKRWGLSRAPSIMPRQACVYGMFDPERFGACPVCHRRVGTDEADARARRDLEQSREALRWVQRLDLGTDKRVAAQDVLTQLLARATPLSPADRDDLRVLLQAEGAQALNLLPEHVSQRETLALVLGTLLPVPAATDEVLARLDDQVRTATDLLRVLEAAGGGDASLTGPVRVPRLPRAVRRAVLARLDALEAQNLAEDLGRHPGRWKRIGRLLHPFEFAARFPRVTVAFAALRGTSPADDALGRFLREAPQLPGLHLETRPSGSRLRFTRWNGRVEVALACGDIPEAVGLLKQRPGEFGRRLDAVLRAAMAGEPESIGAVREGFIPVVPRLTTPMLLLLRAHLSARASVWPTRLVFPKGSAHAFALPDTRIRLPTHVTRPFVESMEAELLARAAQLHRAPVVVLDERLKAIPAPYAERSAARALVTLSRGARLTLPEGRFARLFVYWMEHGDQRVDLDLSVALYGTSWKHLGTCDFTHLRFARTGAVHSGDLTSAPAPLGASEFIDLDVETLRGRGVRYVVMTVLSYNGVPFEQMADAFAGYMLREHADGPVFDARAVEQRFDLRGNQKVSVPLALDLGFSGELPVMHWLDTTPHARSLGETVGHQVAVYHDVLGLSARRVIEAASVKARPTLWDVAALHAAARAEMVVVQHRDGSLSAYHRQGDQPAAAFLSRLEAAEGFDDVLSALPSAPTLGFFLYHDRPLPPGSQAVTLRTSVADEVEVELRTFEQALTDLTLKTIP